MINVNEKGVNVTFSRYEKLEYYITLRDLFLIARKNIYIIDDDITLDIIYLLKDVDNNVQVTIISNNKNKILQKDINSFLKKYCNVNLLIRKNSQNYQNRDIVIDYGKECRYATIDNLHSTDEYSILFKMNVTGYRIDFLENIVNCPAYSFM